MLTLKTMDLMGENDIERIDFWFDPVRPWTWITSRWLTDVVNQLGLDVTWHPFSLAILREKAGRRGTPRDSHVLGRALGEGLVAVREQHGNAAVARVYSELGRILHNEERHDVQAFSEALGHAGVSVDPHVDADELLRVSTHEGIEAVGPGVGSPILAVNSVAFFGPVISPRPRGDAALRLWHSVCFATQTPGFYELKRGRTVDPQFDEA